MVYPSYSGLPLENNHQGGMQSSKFADNQAGKEYKFTLPIAYQSKCLAAIGLVETNLDSGSLISISIIQRVNLHYHNLLFIAIPTGIGAIRDLN